MHRLPPEATDTSGATFLDPVHATGDAVAVLVVRICARDHVGVRDRLEEPLADDLRRDPRRDPQVRTEGTEGGIRDLVCRPEERDRRPIRPRMVDRHVGAHRGPLAGHTADAKRLELAPVVWIGNVVRTEPDPEEHRAEAAASVTGVTPEAGVGVERRAEPVGLGSPWSHDPRELEELEAGFELAPTSEREVCGLDRERADADVVRRRLPTGRELAIFEHRDAGVGSGVRIASSTVGDRRRRIGHGHIRQRPGVMRRRSGQDCIVPTGREEEC